MNNVLIQYNLNPNPHMFILYTFHHIDHISITVECNEKLQSNMS